MGNSGSAKSKRGCGSWLLGSILLVVAVVIAIPLLMSKDSQLFARIESALKDGRTEIETGAGDTLAVDRAVGFVIAVEWNGEEVADEDYEVDDGVITVFDQAGGVLCSVPIDAVNRPEWQALSPWQRLGFWPERHGRTLHVTDLRAGSPADAAGLRAGDVIERCDGWPAVSQGLRAALLSHLAGGELTLQVSRDGEPLDLAVALPELLPAELLEGSSDPLNTWMQHAAR